jgi:hypothetical protein
VETQGALRREHLEGPAVLADAMGMTVAALVAVTVEPSRRSTGSRRASPTASTGTPTPRSSAPCQVLGMILGARALGEFGDDPNGFVDATSRKNYAATSPITRASGKHRVALARYARNRRLADGSYL